MTCLSISTATLIMTSVIIAITALLIASYLRHVAMRVRFADHAFDILGRIKDEEPNYKTAYARLYFIEQTDKDANCKFKRGLRALDYAERLGRFNEESGT